MTKFSKNNNNNIQNNTLKNASKYPTNAYGFHSAI